MMNHEVINDFQMITLHIPYKRVVVDCAPPDIYFASSNIALCATQQQK